LLRENVLVFSFSSRMYMYVFLEVFIPIYRGFERRWKLAGTSTCLDCSFDSSPLIFCSIW